METAIVKYRPPVGMSTKLTPNLIGNNHAAILLNTELEFGDWRRRYGSLILTGPPSLPRYFYTHKDMAGNEYLLAWCVDGEVYFTTDMLIWTHLLCPSNPPPYFFGLNQNYLPNACTFLGDCYGVNGFNGTIKFTGSQNIEVVGVPPCYMVAAGDGRLIAISLVSKPYAIRFSAFRDGTRWTGSENADAIYGKIGEQSPDLLPKVDYYEFDIGDGEPIIGYWRKHKTHMFFKNKSIYVGYGGADPNGEILMDERFHWHNLTQQIGCLSGRTIAEHEGWVIWRGGDGQMYGWDGQTQGSAGTEQFGIHILRLSDPIEDAMPSIGNLMDYANGGYVAPDYSIGSVGPDVQPDWATGDPKTYVDTTTVPGSIVATKNAVGDTKKENYEPTINYWQALYTKYFRWPPVWPDKWCVKGGNRFKCTEATKRVRGAVKMKIMEGLGVQCSVQILKCNSNGIPDITLLKGEGFFWATGITGGAEQTIIFNLTCVENLELDALYALTVECIRPGYKGWEDYQISLGFESPGGDPDPMAGLCLYYEEANGYRHWEPGTQTDMWYQLYAGSEIYQDTSVWFKCFNKVDDTAPWGTFSANEGKPVNTDIAYKILCKDTPVTNADLLVAIANGAIIGAAQGGDVPANIYIGIRVEGSTSGDHLNTWQVAAIKAAFARGEADTALTQGIVWNGKYYLLLKEGTLDSPWNPDGAADVQNVILVREPTGGYHLRRGFKEDGANQTDYAFNAIAVFKGKLYAALANVITVEAAEYRMAQLEYDQEFDLVDDADHLIYQWARTRMEDFGRPQDLKRFDYGRFTREENGSSSPFRANYSLDGGPFYPLGYRQNEMDGTILGYEISDLGLDYAVGDVFLVNDGTYAYFAVKEIYSDGAVMSLDLLYGGWGYEEVEHTTTTIVGTGSGCKITPTEIMVEDTNKIHPPLYTDGYINSLFYTRSLAALPLYPSGFGGNISHSKLYYPNFERLEYPAQEQKTVGYRIQHEIKTVNKLRLQGMEFGCIILENSAQGGGGNRPIPVESGGT